MGRAARARALFATWANGLAVCTCVHARLSAYALDAPSCSGAAETYALRAPFDCEGDKRCDSLRT